MAKALRNINPLLGKAYATGDTIPDAVISSLSPQTVRALINNHSIEVEGMDPDRGSGVGAHLKAVTEKHHERIKALEARLDALEGKAPAEGETETPPAKKRRKSSEREG